MEIRKILIVVLYRFVHEFNPKHISNMFNVATSTIHKYVDIICDVQEQAFW
jgi:predicted AAA+ superfamily ATPase